MPLSRRSFVRTLGVAGAGAAVSPLLALRGREALAAELPWGALDDAGAARLAEPAAVIRLHSNENPRGPSAAALEGIRGVLGECALYPYAMPGELRKAIGALHDVPEDHVILGCGSSEVLRMAMDAFTGADRALVTGSPTYELPVRRAKVLGTPVREVRVDAALRLDLEGMAARARGAGLVFLCNPNNPTGTVHGARAVAEFVARVHAEEPRATVLVDEAYHDYVDDPSYATAIPLALESPRVVVSRTFSKAYGLAGLRVGYAIARPETLEAMARHQLGLAMNVLGMAAARAALADRAGMARERELNRAARDFTRRFFESAGFTVAPSHTNFVMADIRRDAKAFQEACRAHDVLVGRPFPPLDTHVRVSIGTMEEMRAAVRVFEQVLG